MIKKSSSRNQRSKGFKVKHVLQILLLLCICFWLVYQIKCSYDRSREVSEKGSKTPVKEEGEEDDSGGGLKLGRKDLHEKQREEEDEESKDEDEGNQGEREDVVDVDDDEIRRDVERLEAQERLEEQERLEGKKDEGDAEDVDNREEDEGREEEEGSNDKMDEADDERGDNDSEINEADVEGGGADIDREEDFLDEDKGGREERVEDEGEEENGGDKDEQDGDDDVPEDKDPDEVGENTHEARDAHYQADNASGAVAHHTHDNDENAGEEESNNPRFGDRLTESKAISLSEKDSEATASTITRAEANSNASDGNKQASNVSVLRGTEFTGSRGNVADSAIDLPIARKLAAPNRDRDDVSLEQTIGMKTENVSSTKKTQNYQTDFTLGTSTQDPVKPSDLSNKQTLRVSDDFANWEKRQEIDGSLKTQPVGKDQGNVIRMELPSKHDRWESQTL
ncbi:hypothetical protein MLD38_032415 [Melastoma candidum]|uniref:Uncharacterized protein n=1 Tax=Melastoma candidum TaxID=119954 RepID=A0ACB9M3S9_9MYRT|nr:hypothetical protein MLD38_032415 [Melastoma candidum]